MKQTYKIYLLLILFILPYFVNLGASSIWDINEAFYAEAPREMLAAGDWITPRFNFQFRLEKPILSYWTILPFYRFFGVSEFSERLPIAMAAALVIVTTYLLGGALFDKITGLFSALILATSFKVFWLARRSIIDTLLLLCVSMAIFFAYEGLRDSKSGRRYIFLFYVAMGLGMLVKGLVAVVLPAAIIGLYLVASKRYHVLKRLRMTPGLLIVLLVAAPWYLAMFYRHGGSYFRFFFWGQHVERYLHASYSLARPIWYYIPTIFTGFFPWSLFLIPAFIYAAKQLRSYRSEPSRDPYLFVGIWFLFVFVFFSLAKGKQEEYMVQLYPACALLVGHYFRSFYIEQPSVLLSNIFSALAALLFAAAAIFYFHIAYRLFGFENFSNLLPAVVMALLSVSLIGVSVRGKMTALFPLMASATCLTLLLFVAAPLPHFEKYKPVKPLAAKIKSEAETESRIGSYNVSLPSLCFYTGRPIFEIVDRMEMEKVFSSGRRVFCLMDERDYNDFTTTMKHPLHVLDRKPKLSTTGKGFLDLWRDGPLNHIVLVSNKP